MVHQDRKGIPGPIGPSGPAGAADFLIVSDGQHKSFKCLGGEPCFFSAVTLVATCPAGYIRVSLVDCTAVPRFSAAMDYPASDRTKIGCMGGPLKKVWFAASR